MDFSIIQQSPEIRALVQDNALIREFKDALYPKNLFRGEAAPVPIAANASGTAPQAGDKFIFTGNGLMAPNSTPMVPGEDPEPNSFEKEQWDMQLHQYGDRAPDTHMPTSIVAIANLFTNNIHTLGLHAAQSLNRAVRNRLYNAAMSGNTVATANSSGTTITVARLNGFTTARRPDLAAGEPVAFAPVSANNPLRAILRHGGADVTLTITGFTPTYTGDDTGPGTLTVLESPTVTARDAITAVDKSSVIRPAGVLSVDGLTSTTTHAFSFDVYREAVANLEDNNVPKMPDGFYHAHFNSYSKNQLFSSDEMQRLLTSLPDYYWYKEFTIGETLGALIFQDTETPRTSTLAGGNTYTGHQKRGDRFGGEAKTTAGVDVQRPIFIGAEAIYEYWVDLKGLVTEAGVIGQIGDFSQLTNNGVEVNADRIQCYIRSPVNVMGDVVTAVWKAIMDFPCRTDVTTGDASRFKRARCVEHI